MKKRFFKQAACDFCVRETNFKLLSERDDQGRTVMVCMVCGRRQPKPGDQGRQFHSV